MFIYVHGYKMVSSFLLLSSALFLALSSLVSCHRAISMTIQLNVQSAVSLMSAVVSHQFVHCPDISLSSFFVHSFTKLCFSPFQRPFSRWTWVSRCLLKQRTMEVVVTTGAISGAKLQSNRHHQQTNVQFFYRPDALPVAQPTVSKHWRKIVGYKVETLYRRFGLFCKN